MSGISGKESTSSTQTETKQQAITVHQTKSKSEKKVPIVVKEQETMLPSPSARTNPSVKTLSKSSQPATSMNGDQIINIKIDVPKTPATDTNKVQDVFLASRMKAEQSLKNLAKRKPVERKGSRIVQTSSNGRKNQLPSSSRNTSASVQKTKGVKTSVVDRIKNTATVNLLTDIKSDTNIGHEQTRITDKVPQTRLAQSNTKDIVMHESQKSSVAMGDPQIDFAHHSSEWTSISQNGPVRADHPRWMEHGHELSHGKMIHRPHSNLHSSHHTQTVVGIAPKGICISHFVNSGQALNNLIEILPICLVLSLK